MKIGFVGLGHMGAPMSRRLIDAGHTVIGADLSASARDALVEAGGIAVGSPREVADQCEIVCVSLPTPSIVEAVALGDNGLIHGSAIRIFIDLSTTGAMMSRRVAEALLERNIETVDSPVSGGMVGAAKGTLAIMSAGADAPLEEVKPILDNLGNVHRVGDEAGKGQIMKLVNNYLSALALTGTSEAMTLGVKAGLDPDVMIEVFNGGSGRNSATADKFPRSVLPRTFDYGFALALMRKDLQLFADEASSMSVPIMLGSVLREIWIMADAAMPGADFTRIVTPYEEWTGVTVTGSAARG